jgi:hypothetical protein
VHPRRSGRSSGRLGGMSEGALVNIKKERTEREKGKE